MSAEKKGRLVYSTDKGRLCPECQRSVEACICAALDSNRITGDGKVRIRRETKGRKGKGVTLIEGLALNQHELDALAKEIKARCSCGGAVKNGNIEIQGDHRPVIQTLLATHGIKSVIAGG